MRKTLTENLRPILIGIAVLAIFTQWLLPIAMSVSRTALELIGFHINWLVYALLVIAMLALVLLDFPKRSVGQIVFIIVAAGLDSFVGEIAARGDAYLYWDVLFSVLVGAMLGPTAGALSASMACMTWVFLFPPALPYAAVNIVAGWLAGIFSRLGGFSNLLTSLVSGLVTGIVCTIVVAPTRIALWDHENVPGNFDLSGTLVVKQANFFLDGFEARDFIADPLDKILAFGLAYLLLPYAVALFKGRSTKRVAS